MQNLNVPFLVKEEVENAFKESGAESLSYQSLIARIKNRLLTIKKFLDQSIVHMISYLALNDCEYEEVCINDELHIKKINL